jgi:orotate phosphoribosyltransferase
VKAVRSKNGRVKYVFLIINRFDMLTKALSKDDIKIIPLFDSKELVKNVFLREQQVIK